MDDLVDDLTKIPLSGDDLIEITAKLGRNKNEIGWITYSSLNNISNIHQLFQDGVKCVFILIQPEGSNIGHWVLLAKHGTRIIYYDPYGLSVEEDAAIAKNNRLPMLLKNLNVDVNNIQHQKFGKDAKGDVINTCGRHTAARCFFSQLSNKEYNQKIIQPLIRNKHVDNTDTFINLLTGFLSDSDKVVKTFITDARDPLDIPIAAKERIGGSSLPHTRELLKSRGGILFA